MWSRDGLISREAWATASAVVREAGILKSDIKYDDIIDTSLVQAG
jgi:NitT/TauT family transport system substrate-binding protein